MKPSRGVLKYGAILLVVSGMFVVGILVGRGTSPVSFDTRKFQKRLADIAGRYEEKNSGAEKVKLEFYDALDDPVPSKTTVKKAVPAKPDIPQPLPVKTAADKVIEKKAPALPEPSVPPPVVKADSPVPVKQSLKFKTVKKKTAAISGSAGSETGTPEPSIPESGPYTIQVASYPDFKDALAHMADLEKKGFPVHRTTWTGDGKTWYRVRVGAFPTMEAARKYLERLNAQKIDGMIIKRTSDENNQG